MKPEPLYCEMCHRDGMCWDCASDYHDRREDYANATKRQRQDWWFWCVWVVLAVLAVSALAWSLWPKR